jgi:hypothetical protein
VAPTANSSPAVISVLPASTSTTSRAKELD